MFADDTNYLVKLPSITALRDHVSNLLKLVKQWFGDHNLILNVQKTDCVMFHSEKSKSNFPQCINMEDDDIEVKDCVKFLGLRLDKHLKWGPHIEYLKSKLNSACYTLFMLRNQIRLDILKQISIQLCPMELYSGEPHLK